MRTILLLSSIFSFLLSFEELFHYNIKNFDVIETSNSYKLILKNQDYFDYSSNGFKFFLPKFTTEYGLKILRFNSTGFISGYLSMDKSFSKVLNTSPIELKYYMSDYKSFERQLDYLLNGYTIPYKRVTSISIEGYNIPPFVYNQLNKFVYFKIDHSQDFDNTLKYLVYSFYITLDKPRLDRFLKKRKLSFKDYLNNIYKLNFNIRKLPKTSKKKSKSSNKQVSSPAYALKLHLFLYMKEYGFTPLKREYKLITNFSKERLVQLVSKLTDLKYTFKANFNKAFLIAPSDEVNSFAKKIDKVTREIEHLNFYAKLKKPKCSTYSFNEMCFKNPNYFNNYIYLQLKKDILPNMNIILRYGNYKTFNDVAKYYFEIGAYNKAEFFLQKAYAIKQDPIIIHNLSVLYLTYSPLLNIKKGVFYLKKASLPIDYYNLGVLYYIGKGVKENNKKAREYFLKSPSIPYSKKNIEIMNKYKIGIN